MCSSRWWIRLIFCYLNWSSDSTYRKVIVTLEEFSYLPTVCFLFIQFEESFRIRYPLFWNFHRYFPILLLRVIEPFTFLKRVGFLFFHKIVWSLGGGGAFRETSFCRRCSLVMLNYRTEDTIPRHAWSILMQLFVLSILFRWNLGCQDE